MSYTTLVDIATLQAHLDDPHWLVIDVRHQLSDVGYGEHAYAAGHLLPWLLLHPAKPSAAIAATVATPNFHFFIVSIL